MQNLILAAGLAARSGGEKLLRPYRGETIIEHAVSQSLLANLKTIVVTGYRSDELHEKLDRFRREGLVLVHNNEYELGQGSSTICGAMHLAQNEPFFISLADMPLIEARHYRHLIARLGSHQALRPIYRGRAGHPVLLAPSYLPLILSQKKDFTMRGLLAKETVTTMEVDDEAFVFDIDTDEAYEQLLRMQRPACLAQTD